MGHLLIYYRKETYYNAKHQHVKTKNHNITCPKTPDNIQSLFLMIILSEERKECFLNMTKISIQANRDCLPEHTE